MTEPYIRTYMPGDKEVAQFLEATGDVIPQDKPITSVVMDYDDYAVIMTGLNLPDFFLEDALKFGIFPMRYAPETASLFQKFNAPSDGVLVISIRSSQIDSRHTAVYVSGDKLPPDLQMMQDVYEALPATIKANVDETATALSKTDEPESLIISWGNAITTIAGKGTINSIWRNYLKQIVASAKGVIAMNKGRLPDDFYKDQFLPAFYRRLLGTSAQLYLEGCENRFNNLRK